MKKDPTLMQLLKDADKIVDAAGTIAVVNSMENEGEIYEGVNYDYALIAGTIVGARQCLRAAISLLEDKGIPK